jgi:hypothetical protein
MLVNHKQGSSESKYELGPPIQDPKNIESRLKRLSSFHESDHNELATYVKNYYQQN